MSDKKTKTTLTPEQLRVIEHARGNLLVSASAGSGKTHTMIERLIKLVSEGKTSIERVLALTFTEASASDMKKKLLSALTDRVKKGGDKGLLKEIDKIPYADISTIDSFCNRLVKKYFFIAGVSPDYGIADDSIGLILKAEAMEKTFRYYYSINDQEFLSLVDKTSTNRKDGGLRKSVQFIYDHVETEIDFDGLFNATINAYSLNSFKSQLRTIEEYVDKNLSKALCFVCQAEDGLSELGINKHDDLISSVKDVIIRIKEQVGLYNKKKVNKIFKRLDFGKNNPEEAVYYFNKVKTAVGIVKDIGVDLDKYLSTEENDVINLDELKKNSEKLFEIVKKYKEFYDAEKREENLLDFADVERYALKVLQAQQDIAMEYDYVFIDEYQDVNGIQEEIINAITNNNLFMVGDVKQSIYGFRGCRPNYFEEKYNSMKVVEGCTEKLNHNFRSAPKVISAINKVFCYGMEKEHYGSDYKGHSELIYGGLFGDFEGRASFDLLIKQANKSEKETPRIYDVKEEIKKPQETEASDTLTLISQIIKEELGKTRYDIKQKKEVPVTYGDIAVLTRARSTEYVTDVIRGLSLMGIPVTSVAEENVAEYPEVKILISLFRLINNFTDDVALLTVMKSSVGNFSDEELLEICAYSDEFRKDDCYSLGFALNRYANDAEGKLNIKCLEFIKYIKNIRYLADFLSAGEILDRVMQDKFVEANILATDVSEQKLERIRFLRECCDVNGKSYSVKEMVYALDNNDKFLTRLSGGKDNAVKFVSMHSSKGLEFPVVIVAGTEKTFTDMDAKGQVLFDRELGFAIKTYNEDERTVYNTPLRWLFSIRRKDNLFKEELRLFYVALTRASSSLHIACVAKEDLRGDSFDGASKYVNFIPIDLESKIYYQNDIEDLSASKEKRPVLIAEAEKQDSEIKRNLNYIYPYVFDTELPLKASVTELNAQNKEEYYKVEQFFLESNNELAIKKGIVAHKILEYYDFTSNDTALQTANRLIHSGVLTTEDVSLIDLSAIENALFSGAFDKIRKAKLYREKSFLLNLPINTIKDTSSKEEILVQGQLDLLGVLSDGAIIIDYKYSTLTKERLKNKYRTQLNIYSYAVEKILKLKVKEKFIVNLLSGETVIID